MSGRQVCKRLWLLLLVLQVPPLLRAQQGSWPEASARFELDNGLGVVCFVDGNSSNSVVQILVKGGQSLEAPGREGLAYLTLNLSLQLPERLDVRRLMQTGLVYFLSVFPEYAMITIQCPSIHLEEALGTIGQNLSAPLLSDFRIAAVKARLKSLQKQEHDQPLEVVRLAQRRTFFGGASVFGSEASLAAIENKDIIDMHQALFRCKNLMLLVASDLDASVLKEIVAKTCGHFPAGAAAVASPSNAIAGPFAAQRIKLHSAQAHLSSAFRLPPVCRENVIPGVLLEVLLGKGIDSRLWALRSRHDLAYSFDAEFTALKQGSLLGVFLKTDPARFAEAKAFLDAIFSDLNENGVTAAEFAAAQAVAGTEFLKNGESKKQLSALAAHLEGMGLGAEIMEKYISRLRAYTLDEFNRYLNRVLQGANRLDVVVGPESDLMKAPGG